MNIQMLANHMTHFNQTRHKTRQYVKDRKLHNQDLSNLIEELLDLESQEDIGHE